MQRRHFLKLAGAAALGAGLPTISLAARTRRLRADVVIVGAGMAGLSAAHRLWKSGVNSLLVFDARREVGGRIQDQVAGRGITVEGGGEWVGPTQTAVLGLVQELGLATFKTYDTGTDLVAVGRTVIAPDGGADAEISEAKAALDQLSLAVPLDSPWLAPDAGVLDGMSVDGWLCGQGFGSVTRLAFDRITWSTLGALAKDVSLLYFLFYIHSAGGIDQRAGVSGAAQDSRIVGGPQQIPQLLAQRLEGRVLKEVPVRSISQMETGVRVASDIITVDARFVIVSMLPRDGARIAFAPALPPQRQALMRYWPAAKVFKANVAYAEPFWRNRGLSGQVSSIADIYSVFDNSPPSGGAGVLEVFSKSGSLPASKEERIRAILGTLAAYFGPDALKPRGYVEKDWGTETWISGCVSPLPCGFLTALGPALKDPVGRVFWASAETADVWNGKMDGAVRAGYRAADDVLARL
jgi:monoamine oxidase